MGKAGRPKEDERVHWQIRILPGTAMKIDKQVRKGKKELCSRGKIIDGMFNKKGASAIEVLILAAIIGVISAVMWKAIGKRESIPANIEQSSRFRTITIEGCEYIEFDENISTRVYNLIHKGNCSNPIHQHSK